MRRLDVLPDATRMMAVCNSCRYCEQYCPVFPAVARRRTFARGDLYYLANLCHNCGECLYACQYAPPHEFGVDVPRTLAALRLDTYEAYCWPHALHGAFRRHRVGTAVALAAALSAILGAATWVFNPEALTWSARGGDFYAVVPHLAMVSLFGGVAIFVLVAMAIGVRRFWRDTHSGPPPDALTLVRGLREAMTLRHLHGSGRDCTSREEVRRPWRRYWHHLTFYGFLLCFASTSVAALYHSALGWEAPYPYTSLPVALGTAGGLGLLIGPIGLLISRRRRDPALATPDQHGLDESFLVLLWLTSLTGLLLVALRDGPAMAALLIVHLGVVLALFVTLPYGKFMHGLYRSAALVKSALEARVAPFERQ